MKVLMARSTPRQVVYLWGAGGTQAEASYLGAQPINILMKDSDQLGEGIASRILKRLGKEKAATFQSDHGVDIEKLISLLTATGIEEYSRLAEEIRRYYFLEIRNSLALAQIINKPRLAIGLLTLHANKHFNEVEEVLSGIITTNHDGLLQVAAQVALGGVNLGFKFASSDFITLDSAPPILGMHGSFTWSFSVPPKVKMLRKATPYSADTVWIPPMILKDSKAYPFNKLAGVAYELLARQCDVLRVVGSSLTQNDWNILSLIFNAQRHREYIKGSAFRIELIMPHAGGESIQRDCSYLKNVTPIGHLTDGQFSDYKEEPAHHTAEMKNPFAYWLKEKVRFHLNHGSLGIEPLPPALAAISGELNETAS